MESDARAVGAGPRTGARDEVVLDLSRRARAQLRCQNHQAIVSGASLG